MSVTRLKVSGQFDKAGGPRPGTVEIDRSLSLFRVRPLRSRETYTLPLSVVAEMVVHRIILGDAASKQKVKRVKRGLL